MPKIVKEDSKAKPKKKGGSVIDRVMPLAVDDVGIKLNVYGESGSGKTTFWATFPGRVLALIASGGVGAGELRSINTPEYRKKIDMVPIEKSIEVMELALHHKDRNDYSTIVLDHASGLQHMVLAEVLGLDPSQVPVQLSWGIAAQEQWGIVGMQMKELMRSLLNMPQHVVIVAQQREFEATRDSDTIAMPHVGSALSPSIVGWLNPACDYICQTFKRQNVETVEVTIGEQKVKQTRPGKGVQYCLRTAAHATFMTKFRVPKGQPLPEDIVNPDFDKLMSVIKGKSL